MALLQIQNLCFTHEGETEPIFQNVNLELDTRWKLGLIGRNGRGKTTLLKLLLGLFEYQGSINCPERFEYFPADIRDAEETVLEIARDLIAPFSLWERQLAEFAAEASEASIQLYGELEQRYAEADGYIINDAIRAEARKLGIHPLVLNNPYNTLSGGEQVKLMLAALFLKKHSFLLIDEPTDHLDAEGRQQVATWLNDKSGYILVSHDRAFLDDCIDHVLSINRADIELQKGNYSTWRENRELKDNYEQREHQKLAADIGRLKESARQSENWSAKIESSKRNTGAITYNHGPPMVDRGYIGHQAARMMQRSKSIARRKDRQIKEKESLLKNVETVEPLRVQMLPTRQKQLITAENVSFGFGERSLFENISLSVNVGDRALVKGANGTGKSTFLQLLAGTLQSSQGSIWRQAQIVISSVPQDITFLAGTLQSYAERNNLDESLFLAILRKLNFQRANFTRDLSLYSQGEKKKVCLASSFATPAHLYIWDEPVNYIDVLSREQVEKALLECNATIVFVEHDRAFSQNIATKIIQL